MSDIATCSPRFMLPFISWLEARAEELKASTQHHIDIIPGLVAEATAEMEKMGGTLLTAAERSMHNSRSKYKDQYIFTAFDACCVCQRALADVVKGLGGDVRKYI